ncbi:MAG: TraB/GumN family protein [Ruminococcus flavefaciens]|nr:TraB/GumN family protein [Ruminococcus flavefaciens]
MKKKKILCAFLTAFLAVTAVSCGNDESSESSKEITESSATEQEETTEEITTEEETTEETTSEAPAEEETTAETEPETSEETTKKSSSENVSVYGTMADLNSYVTSAEVAPPLWKVTDPETNNEIYIMGTIHVLPESFTEFPDYVMDIYENCDGVAVEYDVTQITSDIRALMAYQQMFLYDDGTTITDHISDDTYQKAKSYFESIGAYVDELDQFSAGYWYNQLESAMMLRLENLSTTGVDSSFIEYANNDGKEVVDIETLDIQVGAVDGMSDELVDFVMNEMLDNMDEIDDYAETLAELYDAWATGNVDVMLEENNEEIDELPADLQDDYADYMDIMLYNRNKGMADRASEFLKDGKNYLFMVGSMHYAGDKGVDDLLAEMGYTVEKIS